jgi:hypothetical protein
MSTKRAKARSGVAKKFYRCKNKKAYEALLAVNENIYSYLTYNVDRRCVKKKLGVWVGNV